MAFGSLGPAVVSVCQPTAMIPAARNTAREPIRWTLEFIRDRLPLLIARKQISVCDRGSRETSIERKQVIMIKVKFIEAPDERNA